MAQLKGKVAVVTGSSRGFGFEVARAFAGQGADVMISSRYAEQIERAVRSLHGDGLQVDGKVCDVTDLNQVQSLLEHTLDTFGHLDVWVNNAGSSAPYGPTIHQESDRFVQVTNTNILGVYYGSLIAMRHFLRQRSGKLINILGRGERRPVPMQNAYSSSKAWVKSFTLALAAEYADWGVGVFALSPGMMDTDMILDVEVIQGYEARLKTFNSVVQSLSQPPELSTRKVVWLASAATDGKTGLVARELTSVKLALRGVQLLLGKFLRRPGRHIDIKIRGIPATFPSDGKPRA